MDEGSLFQLPEGFVGWAGDINIPLSSIKMYGSFIPVNYVQQQYEAYTQSIRLDLLSIKPNKSGKSIKDVFFNNSNSFSYHFSHQDFEISTTSLDNSLMQLLNFPSDDGKMTPESRVKQDMFLREFIGSYKGFQLGKVVKLAKGEEYGCTNVETQDKSYFIRITKN